MYADEQQHNADDTNIKTALSFVVLYFLRIMEYSACMCLWHLEVLS